MAQVLTRLPNGWYKISDHELVLICTPTTSLGNVELIGSAFHSRRSGWRLLRRGLCDIGYSPTCDLAVSRLLDDAAKYDPQRTELPAAVRPALPR